ncbi:MAG: hypothetical protein COB78_10760 [Hyphomicrobiales bacterium]|nr:MAG: hypothetical protein COB78_10760 [Hyphomicrobiales bacterium]
MPKFNVITAGSVALANGSKDVVGLNTAINVSGVKRGDVFNSGGLVGTIDVVADDTHFTLIQAWPGETGAGQEYMITRDGGAVEIVGNETRLEEIIRKIEAGLFLVPGDEGTLASRAAHDGEESGFLYVVTDDASGDMFGYIKASATSGDWAGPFAWRGPQGNPGEQGPLGPPAEPSKTGLAVEQSNYDDEPTQFSFLAYDTSLLYFKLSASSGDWSTGIPWGKGDKGNTGEIAIGVVSTGAAGSNVIITNVGTSTDAILDITIPQGDRGYVGWSTVLAIESDVLRLVVRVVDWTDGEGSKPEVGMYIGPSGFVATAAEAVDIRGEPGLSSSTGDMFQSEYDPTASGKVLAAGVADSVEWAGVANKPATFPPSSTTLANDPAPQLGAPLDTNSKSIQFSNGTPLVSATAQTLGADGNTFALTGGGNIESINTVSVGCWFHLYVIDPLDIVHDGDGIIVQGGSTVSLRFGDMVHIWEYAVGKWWVYVSRADGTAVTAPASESYLINGDFTVNQRGAATKAQAVGVYGYDRWKGHTDGLEQVVEALPAGEYTLTWAGGGTATFGGTTAISPIVATVIAGNVSVIVPSTATLVSLVSGNRTASDPFAARLFGHELVLCQRYYWKSYDYDVAPGATGFDGSFYTQSNSSLKAVWAITFGQHLRIRPTVTWYSVSSGAPDKVYVQTGDVTPDLGSTGQSGVSVFASAASPGLHCYAQLTADAEIY